MAQEKSKIKKAIDRGDLTIATAIVQLKEEIVEEVRRVSAGSQQSIFSLVEKGKELNELEAMLKDGVSPSKKSAKAGKKVSGGGIVAQEELSEDDF